MKRLLRTGLLVSFAVLAGCSTPGYRSLNPSCLTPSAQPKYERDGHQDTTEIVARLAGLDPQDAARLAFFNQAADDLALRYAATRVSVWASFGRWDYRHRINAVLHSLHGGDAAAVAQRRLDLATAIAARRADGSGGDWQTGFLIHALGDSYAHTDASGTAYGELYGHLFDGHGPDLVGLRRELYLDYVDRLFDALERPGHSDRDGLAAFKAHMRAVPNGDVAAHRAAILDWRDGQGPAASLACDDLASQLRMRDVSRFLQSVEADFRAGRPQS